jgi:hypothetical protein
MIHVTAVITPCVPPKVVGQVTSLIMVTALPEVYGLPRSWSPREVGGPHCEARRAIGVEVARWEYLTRAGSAGRRRITG